MKSFYRILSRWEGKHQRSHYQIPPRDEESVSRVMGARVGRIRSSFIFGEVYNELW